jgi:hypothetical protein
MIDVAVDHGRADSTADYGHALAAGCGFLRQRIALRNQDLDSMSELGLAGWIVARMSTGVRDTSAIEPAMSVLDDIFGLCGAHRQIFDGFLTDIVRLNTSPNFIVRCRAAVVPRLTELFDDGDLVASLALSDQPQGDLVEVRRRIHGWPDSTADYDSAVNRECSTTMTRKFSAYSRASSIVRQYCEAIRCGSPYPMRAS